MAYTFSVLKAVKSPSNGTKMFLESPDSMLTTIRTRQGATRGEVYLTFPTPSSMSGFYTDVHGLTLPGSTDVLRLRMLGVPKSKVGEYTSATAEEYANYVVDEFFASRPGGAEKLLITPSTNKVADEVDNYKGKDEAIEKEFEAWLENFMEGEGRRRKADGVVVEGVVIEEEEEEGAGGGEEGPWKEPIDEFEVMDNLSYTGETGLDTRGMSQKERKTLRETLAMWDSGDSEVQGMERGLKGGDKGAIWDEAYREFVKRLREEEGWRSYYDSEDEIPKLPGGEEGGEEGEGDDGEIRDTSEEYNPFNPAPRGDWAETIVKVDRVQKVTRGGVIMKYRSLVVAGNNKGAGGYGVGKGESPREALLLASRDARRSLVFVDRYEGTALTSDCVGKHNGCKVVIRAVPPGYGMKAGRLVREILLQFGISDASAKAYGNRNPYSVVRATMKALKGHEGLEVIARKRGKRIMSLKRAKRLQIS